MTELTLCSICHDEINEKTGSTRLSCSHEYHLGCIVSWLSKKDTCPCCRNEVSEYEKVKKDPLLDLNYFNNLIEAIEIHGFDTNEETNQLSEYEMFHFNSPEVELRLPPQIARMPIQLDPPLSPSSH